MRRSERTIASMNAARSASSAVAREHLFELVDGDQVGVRERAGADERLRPVLAPRQDTTLELGQQPRPQRRRLAAARRPDHREQRRAREPRDHRRHQALAPEEELRVGDVVRREAFERAHDDGPSVPLGALAHRLQLRHPAGQLPLGPPQAPATRLDPVGDRGQPPLGLGPRPLGGDPVRGPREPAALRGEPLGGDHGVGGRVQRGDLRHRRDVERPERDPRRTGHQPAARDHHQPKGAWPL